MLLSKSCRRFFARAGGFFLENITVQKAHGQAKSFTNVEGVHETNVRIGELIAETAGGR